MKKSLKPLDIKDTLERLTDKINGRNISKVKESKLTIDKAKLIFLMLHLSVSSSLLESITKFMQNLYIRYKTDVPAKIKKVKNKCMIAY